MKIFFAILFLFQSSKLLSQNIHDRLSSAVNALQNDEQFKHALLSLYVVDSKTGKVIFEKNAQLGLAPASTQKVITSVSALELLGKDYTYKTQFVYYGMLNNTVLNGNIFIKASGDPTTGSWRWKETREESIKTKLLAAMKNKNISSIKGDLIIDDAEWETQATPRGWIWEDIGNYFGAGARALNWKENQYDIILKPGTKAGDSVGFLRTDPYLPGVKFINELKTAKAGSGDNSIIYLPENGLLAYIRGTLPAGNENFTIKGSLPNAPRLFLQTILTFFAQNKIEISGKGKTSMDYLPVKKLLTDKPIFLTSLISPSLDSINYWFLKKSVNLFGEAFVKTISYEKTGFGSTDTGLNIIRTFWSKKGIEKSALKILDGSGLSPANRITTHALVTVMLYAKQQSWFSLFNDALPEMNGIKMKDGYISSVRSYTGYVKSKTGVEYTFAFIANNFDGSPGSVREKMWQVLDILK
jgi:serine-type D-Ala-D-Ala carboxypeptidase/endopeptidase (penicillin-binding protein 4)